MKQVKKDTRKDGSFNLHLPAICKAQLTRHYSEHLQESWQEPTSAKENLPQKAPVNEPNSEQKNE